MFTIYFAHHWDFNKKSAFSTISEAKRIWKEQGMSEKEIKQQAKNLKSIKIGQTHAAGRRNCKLFQDEGIHMKQKFKFEGTLADALFVESYVRSKIERHFPFNCSHSGTDHFWANNTNIIRYIDKNFLSWCEEGLQVLKGMG